VEECTNAGTHTGVAHTAEERCLPALAGRHSDAAQQMKKVDSYNDARAHDDEHTSVCAPEHSTGLVSNHAAPVACAPQASVDPCGSNNKQVAAILEDSDEIKDAATSAEPGCCDEVKDASEDARNTTVTAKRSAVGNGASAAARIHNEQNGLADLLLSQSGMDPVDGKGKRTASAQGRSSETPCRNHIEPRPTRSQAASDLPSSTITSTEAAVFCRNCPEVVHGKDACHLQAATTQGTWSGTWTAGMHDMDSCETNTTAAASRKNLPGDVNSKQSCYPFLTADARKPWPEGVLHKDTGYRCTQELCCPRLCGRETTLLISLHKQRVHDGHVHLSALQANCRQLQAWFMGVHQPARNTRSFKDRGPRQKSSFEHQKSSFERSCSQLCSGGCRGRAPSHIITKARSSEHERK
jgi:hypothetical protein